MKIAICDDELAICKVLENAVHNFFARQSELCEITCYTSGIQLLNSNEKYDGILLDIDMPEMDGIKVGKEYLKKSFQTTIIMVTSHVERYKDGYKIGAFRFVTKPVTADELYEALQGMMKQKAGNKKVQIRTRSGEICVRERDICYIMANRSETYCYIASTEYRSEKSLEQWEKELDPVLFVRSHRSFIVNMQAISQIDGNEIILYSGEKIMISRRLKKNLVEKYRTFDLGLK